MIEGIIYIYTSPSNKVYIGQTVDENERMRKHISDSKNLSKKRNDSYFHRAVAKYGIDQFTYEVLFKTKSNSKDRIKVVLNAMEKYYIKKYNSMNPNKGYNLTIGGEGVVGRKHTLEEKQKISLKVRGEKNGMYGTTWNQAQKDGNYSRVLMFSKDDVFIREFESIKEAEQFLGKRSNISACCRGERKTSNGYKWKYKN